MYSFFVKITFLKHPLINMYNSSHLIQFPKIGGPSLGYISLTKKEDLPFIPKRIYWTYFTPEGVDRGNHSF
jgi:hypothetical protein